MNTNYINKFQRDVMIGFDNISPVTKLTDTVLYKIGFRGEGRDCTNKPAFRFEVPPNEKYGYYYGEIQIVLGDYPDTNPNCGILSIYRSAVKDAHMIVENDEHDQADHVLWDSEGMKGGIKYIDIPEDITPIANHVNTLERLNQIYVALTGKTMYAAENIVCSLILNEIDKIFGAVNKP